MYADANSEGANADADNADADPDDADTDADVEAEDDRVLVRVNELQCPLKQTSFVAAATAATGAVADEGI